MAAEQPKDTTSFFRKVVKFVANPSTDWTELDAPVEDTRESDYAKGELKAMIERKRRNDFVRKREFDMLRKVRREGLSSEQLAALGSSRLDDSQPRISDQPVRQDAGVKAKIDEIEQQMVGDTYATTQRARAPEFYNAPTQPVPMDFAAGRPAAPAAPTPPAQGGRVERFLAPLARPAAAAPAAGSQAPAPARAASIAPIRLDMPPAEDFGKAFSATNSEVTHDPDLDEAVIAFANADFEQCEQALATLTGPAGARAQHAETWLVLFDLYRATGQQHKFESLALDYAQQFGWSAPQWFSMPKLVAEAASEERPSSARIEGQVGWVCPHYLDADGVAKLASLALQMPLPWVFDWGALQTIDAEACGRLSELFRSWIPQDLDMRWLVGRSPVRRPAGSRAHWRARRRPGVLAGAPRCVAHDQPARPVRRGRDRLLRHLRSLAAVVGTGALRRAHQRLEPEHDGRRRCRWSATSRPASRSRSSPTTRRWSRWPRSSSPASSSATSA